jgi:hypothetical protein
MIRIGSDVHGEIAFGAQQVRLDLGYNQSLVHFTWPDLKKWTKSLATDMPNCSMMAQSRSRLPVKTGIRFSSTPNTRLLQQPARLTQLWLPFWYSH